MDNTFRCRARSATIMPYGTLLDCLNQFDTAHANGPATARFMCGRQNLFGTLVMAPRIGENRYLMFGNDSIIGVRTYWLIRFDLRTMQWSSGTTLLSVPSGQPHDYNEEQLTGMTFGELMKRPT